MALNPISHLFGTVTDSETRVNPRAQIWIYEQVAFGVWPTIGDSSQLATLYSSPYGGEANELTQPINPNFLGNYDVYTSAAIVTRYIGGPYINPPVTTYDITLVSNGSPVFTPWPATLTQPASNNFTWLNQANANVSDQSGRLYISVAPQNNDLVLFEQTANLPAYPYTIDVGVALPAAPLANLALAGIGLSNSNSDIVLFTGFGSQMAQTFSTNFVRAQWTNANTFGSFAEYPYTPTTSVLSFARVTDDGTTRTYWTSQNGLDYGVQFAEASGNVITPANVSLAFYNDGSNSQNAVFSVYHWNVANVILPSVSPQGIGSSGYGTLFYNNGNLNSSQFLLDLVNGSNISIVDLGNGNIQINANVAVPDDITLETNGNLNSSQTLLNLVAGGNIKISDTGNGNIQISVTNTNVAPITLENNGNLNSSQLALNLVAGSNITITDTGSGNIRISGTAVNVANVQFSTNSLLNSNQSALNLVAGGNIVLSNTGGSTTIAAVIPATLTLKNNGNLNSSQTLLNLTGGSNVTITDTGGGSIAIGVGNLSINPVTLQTNGNVNSSQSLLNLNAGNNIVLTDSGNGNIQIASTASGSGGGWPPAWMPLKTPPLTGWTTITPAGGAAPTLTANVSYVNLVGTTSGNWGYALQPAPSTPYSVAVHLYGLTVASSSQAIGVGFADNTNAARFFLFDGGSDLRIADHDSSGGFVGDAGVTFFGYGIGLWFQLADDGTTRTMAIGVDGKNWSTLVSESSSTFITATQLLIAVASSVNTSMIVDSWG